MIPNCDHVDDDVQLIIDENFEAKKVAFDWAVIVMIIIEDVSNSEVKLFELSWLSFFWELNLNLFAVCVYL